MASYRIVRRGLLADRHRATAPAVFLIELFPDRGQRPTFKLADLDRAPSFGSAGRTDEIAHFVMAITAAEAMARHVARCTGELQCNRPPSATCFAGHPIYDSSNYMPMTV